MSDSKVHEMTAATSVLATDLLYLVRTTGSLDLKISISTLLLNLPAVPVKISGQLVLGGVVQTIVGGGTISVTSSVTKISAVTSGDVLNINSGSYEGQIKIVVCTTRASGASSSISSSLGVGSVTFNAVGMSVTLIWLSNAWWPIGGTATISL